MKLKLTAIGVVGNTIREKFYDIIDLPEEVSIMIFNKNSSESTYHGYIDYVMDNSVDKEVARNHIIHINTWMTDMEEQQYVVGWKLV